MDFVVADVEAATEKAIAAGAKLEGPVQSFVWGRQACLSDPFGHGFCLLQWQVVVTMRLRSTPRNLSMHRPRPEPALTTPLGS